MTAFEIRDKRGVRIRACFLFTCFCSLWTAVCGPREPPARVLRLRRLPRVRAAPLVSRALCAHRRPGAPRAAPLWAVGATKKLCKSKLQKYWTSQDLRPFTYLPCLQSCTHWDVVGGRASQRKPPSPRPGQAHAVPPPIVDRLGALSGGEGLRISLRRARAQCSQQTRALSGKRAAAGAAFQ
jgi:hypothetical protein